MILVNQSLYPQGIAEAEGRMAAEMAMAGRGGPAAEQPGRSRDPGNEGGSRDPGNDGSRDPRGDGRGQGGPRGREGRGQDRNADVQCRPS